MERRDCIDVALFQRGRMDQYGALLFVLVKDRLPQYRATAVWTLMARLLAVASTDAIQSSAAGRNRMCRMD
jgi:hypothetical protein